MSEVCEVHFCVKPDHNLETLSIIKLQNKIKQISLRNFPKKWSLRVPGSWPAEYVSLENIWWMEKGAEEGQAFYKLHIYY